MKTAEVQRLDLTKEIPGINVISVMMDKLNRYRIDTINWNEYSYLPQVDFAIAYSNHEIFLKYFVKEDHFKAEMTETNQNVYEDSCVEFFVSPSDDGIYYNFEFNAIGTCLMGSGTSRNDSRRADPEIISSIRKMPSMCIRSYSERHGSFNWELTVAIPFGAFFHHSIKDISGKTFRANFYKCGDKLSVPHFVSWNKIETEKPDFHRPEYFGKLKFI